MTKLYLVTYTPNLSFNKFTFHNFMTSLYPRHISDWWHHIDTTYLVATSLGATQLYSAIYPGVPGSNLLIIEVDPNNAQGWLPQIAWTWLQKYQRNAR